MIMNSSWILKFGNEVLDLVYPPGLYCISCGKITDDSRTYRLCNDCMRAMNWITGRYCEKCGRPLDPNDPGEMCFRCSVREASGSPQSFDKGHACAGYGAGALARMYDIVMPVPTHREKKAKRGYNHADLMAKGFSKRAGLRYDPDAIIRLRATVPMKGLGPEERMANIHGAFDIRARKLPLIEGSRILLIDDIFTTGATIDEISRILKDAGASRVDFLAFAAAGDMVN